MKKLLLASVLALSACATATSPAPQVTEAQVITDVSAFIVAAQQSLLNASIADAQFAASTGYAEMQAALAQAATDVKAVQTGSVAISGATTLQSVETQIGVLLAAASAIPVLPPQVKAAVIIADAVLPELEAYIATLAPQVAPAKAAEKGMDRPNLLVAVATP